IWSWKGNLELFPSYDHFRDEIQVPEVNITMDMSTPWEQFADSPFGTNFGDWRTVSSSSVTSGGPQIRQGGLSRQVRVTGGAGSQTISLNNGGGSINFSTET